MAHILDVESAVLLLEIEPPFDKRAVQLARRRMAKRWHPDIAPAGRQHEHQRHLQAINEAADQLERLAEGMRGGRVTRNAVKVSAAATRKAREEAGRRAYEEEQRARAAAADQAKHDPFGSRVPDHSVVHRYARCLSYPEWGVGTVSGIYFSGDGDDVQQWARVMFAPGVRTVPAGSLQFVDFSKPDAGRRPRAAVRHRRPARDGRRQPRAGRPPSRLRPRRRAEQPRRAAAADGRLLAGAQPARGGAHGARLGPRGDRPADAGAVRVTDLRGHGGAGPRRRGGGPGGASALRPTRRPGSASGG